MSLRPGRGNISESYSGKMDFCLALDRNGHSCGENPYRHSILYFWRSSPVTHIFCRKHDDEYRVLLDRYLSMRNRCQTIRWTFKLRPSDLDNRTYELLRYFEKYLRQAVESLSQMVAIRSLRNQRFAAAFDEFEHDESIDHLREYKHHCFSLLQYCLSLLEDVEKPSSLWQSITMVVQRLFVPAVMKSKNDANRLDGIELTSPTRPSFDFSSSYFGYFGAASRAVQIAHNILPEAVTTRLKDPAKAAEVARRETFRRKLRAFLVTDPSLVDKLGIHVLQDVQRALYRRFLMKDQVLLIKTYQSTASIDSFLDGRKVTADDLERLWDHAYHLNPAMLRDALIDLESIPMDTPRKKVLGVHLAIDQKSQPLSLHGWRILYSVLGDRMSFGDLYFLSATAEEFFGMSRLIAVRPRRFVSLCTHGKTGNNALLVCMRMLGFFVTYWDTQDEREVIVGIMQDSTGSRQFARGVSSMAACSIRAAFANGTIFSNDNTLDFLERSACSQKLEETGADSLRVNLEDSPGHQMKTLYRRSGSFFPDGCEVRIAPRFSSPAEDEVWKLELLQQLAKIRTGATDVCAALDIVLQDVEESQQQDLPPHMRKSCHTQGETLQRLKQQYSRATLNSGVLNDISSVAVRRPRKLIKSVDEFGTAKIYSATSTSSKGPRKPLWSAWHSHRLRLSLPENSSTDLLGNSIHSESRGSSMSPEPYYNHTPSPRRSTISPSPASDQRPLIAKSRFKEHFSSSLIELQDGIAKDIAAYRGT